MNAEKTHGASVRQTWYRVGAQDARFFQFEKSKWMDVREYCLKGDSGAVLPSSLLIVGAPRPASSFISTTLMPCLGADKARSMLQLKTGLWRAIRLG